MATNRIFSILFLFFVFSSNIFAENTEIPTIKAFIEDDKGQFNGYLYGLESGLEWANEHYYRKYNIELFCKPSSISLPASKLRDMVNKSINSKPGFFKKYENEALIGLALRSAYLQEFPCE